MLKQRKHSPFDDQASPDGSHYLGKYLRCLLISRTNWFVAGMKDDDDEDADDDVCSSDGSDASQKGLTFAD